MPVETYDERLTTRMADRSAREGARADRDSLAAAHLLESYLARGARGVTEDRGDWVVDTEGNLTPPGGDGVKPPTDEFGRDDPASIERERRRREREQRRGKSKKPRKVAKAPKQTRARKAAAPPARASRGRATSRARRGCATRRRSPRDAPSGSGSEPRWRRPSASQDPWRAVHAPPLPRVRPGPRRRPGRVVSDRVLPASAVRPRQWLWRGHRHRARGRHGQRRVSTC